MKNGGQNIFVTFPSNHTNLVEKGAADFIFFPTKRYVTVFGQ